MDGYRGESLVWVEREGWKWTIPEDDPRNRS